MVEANPSGKSQVELQDLEERIFEPMEEKIRELNNWFKDLGQEIVERITAIFNENHAVTKSYLRQVRANKQEFPVMLQQKALQQMQDRLLNILQTEDNRNRFLVGEQSDFLDTDGSIKINKIMERLG